MLDPGLHWPTCFWTGMTVRFKLAQLFAEAGVTHRHNLYYKSAP